VAAIATEQDIIQGMDVVITAAGTAGPVLGGAQNGELVITHRKTAYRELSEQVALQLPGVFELTGRLMGAGATPRRSRRWSAPTASGRGIRTRPPKFTVTWTVDAPGKPSHGRRMQMSGCSFGTATWTTRDAENVVDNPVTFDAEAWAIL
jgi:hypothetical protein